MIEGAFQLPGPRPSLLSRIAMIAVGLVAAGVAAVILIPLLVLGAAVVLALVAYSAVRAALSGLFRGSEGRRNVRVIPPADGERA